MCDFGEPPKKFQLMYWATTREGYGKVILEKIYENVPYHGGVNGTELHHGKGIGVFGDTGLYRVCGSGSYYTYYDAERKINFHVERLDEDCENHEKVV